MVEYSPVFIDYCREVMSSESFRIFMEFLDIDKENVYSSLLREEPIVEYPPQED